MAIRFYSNSLSDLTPSLGQGEDPEERRRQQEEAAAARAQANANKAYEMYQERRSGDNPGGLIQMLQTMGSQEGERRRMAAENARSLERSNAFAARQEAETFQRNKELETKKAQFGEIKMPTFSQRYIDPITRPMRAFNEGFNSMDPLTGLGNAAAEKLMELIRGKEVMDEKRSQRASIREALSDSNPKSSFAGKAAGLFGSMAVTPGVGQTGAFAKAGMAGKAGLMGAEGAAYGGGMQMIDNANNNRPLTEGVGASTALGAGMGAGLGVLTTKFGNWLSSRNLQPTEDAVEKFIQEMPEAQHILASMPEYSGPGAMPSLDIPQPQAMGATTALAKLKGELLDGVTSGNKNYTLTPEPTENAFVRSLGRYNRPDQKSQSFMDSLRGVDTPAGGVNAPRTDIQMPGGHGTSALRDDAFTKSLSRFGQPEPMAPVRSVAQPQIQAPKLQGDGFISPMGGARFNTGNIESIPPARYLEAVKEFAGPDVPYGASEQDFLIKLWGKLSKQEQEFVIKQKYGDLENFNPGARATVDPAVNVSGEPPTTTTPRIIPSAENAQSFPPTPYSTDAEVGIANKVQESYGEAMESSIRQKINPAGANTTSTIRRSDLSASLSEAPTAKPKVDKQFPGAVLDDTITQKATGDEAAQWYNQFYDEGLSFGQINKVKTFNTKILPLNLQLFADKFAGKPLKFIENSVMGSDLTAKEVLENFAQHMPRRMPMPMKVAWDKAWEAVEADLSGSISKFTSSGDTLNKDMAALGQAIIVKQMKAGDFAAANDTIIMLAEKGAATGGGVQMLSAFKTLSPEGWLRMGNKQIEAAKKILLEAGHKPNEWVNAGVKNAGDKLLPEDATAIVKLYDEFHSLTRAQQFDRPGQVVLAKYKKILDNYVLPGVGDKLRSYQRVNLLLNPTSLEKNVYGNVGYNALWVAPSQAISVVADNILVRASKLKGTWVDKLLRGSLSKLSSEKTQYLPQLADNNPYKALKEGVGATYNFATKRKNFRANPNAKTSMGRAVNEVLEDSALGIDTSPAGTAVEFDTNVQNAWRDWVNADLPTFPGSLKEAKEMATFAVKYPVAKSKRVIGSLYSGTDKVVKTALKIGDRPFYQMHYDTVIHGYQKTAYKAMSEEAKKGVSMYDIEIPDAVYKQARQIGLQRTFQDLNKFSELMLDLRRAVNKGGYITSAGQKFGAGNIGAPFVLTPSNLAARAGDHTVGGVAKVAKQALNLASKGGEFDQYKFTRYIGDTVTGMGSLYVGVWMYRNGYITGGIPNDKDARVHADQQMNTGFYTMKVPGTDTWVPYDWMQPEALAIAMGADYEQNRQNGTPEDSAVLNAVGTGANTLFNQAMLQTIQRLFGGYSSTGNSNVVENATKIGAQAFSQFVPLGGMQSTLGKTFDTNKRENDDPNSIMKHGVNPMKQRMLPLTQGTNSFSRLGLPEKVDTWGEKVPEQSLIETWLSPARIRNSKPEYIDTELQRMYKESGETKQFPRYQDFELKRTKNKVVQSYSMSAEERVQYQKAYGQLAKGAVEEFMSSGDYNQMDDVERANEISSIYTDIESLLKDSYLQGRE